jgi:alpha-tubulin suppressor-like RCC1 family protein
MKGRSSFLALVALGLALACDDQSSPTGLKTPTTVSKIISDGSHGENPDFFFLPPLVQLKKNNPDFELGKFDRAVHAGLVVEICQLESRDADSDHRGSSNSNSSNSSNRSSNSGDQDDRNSPDFPTAATKCVAGELVKRFGPGTVNLVKLPASRGSFPKQLDPDEWYKGRNLPPDGFYYVLWNTRQTRLNDDKFYRITVLRDGSTPLGFVDVDPRSKGHKWRHSRSGQFIQMVDDVKLPIPFRVERGALCTGVALCTSVVVTGDNPNGDVQVVTVDGGAGAIAGVSFRDGWLPEGPGRPDRVTVTITEVPSAEDPVTHVRTTRCHTDLPFQQFNKCFNFTTTPPLAPIDPEIPSVHFAAEVIVAVCYSLEGIASDPRRKFSQLYTSGPGEQTHALEERNDVGILGPGARNCTTAPQGIGFGGSNPLTRLANTGWQILKGGLGQLFGVKTAYAVDGGLGGIVKRFSNIGPALTADIEPYPFSESNSVELTLEGGTAIARVKIVGNSHHGEGEPTSAGINRVPVTFFTVAEGDAGLTPVGADVIGTNQLIVPTSAFAGDSGIASVSWTPPTEPGPYTLKATGPTMATVTFSVTVVADESPAPFAVTKTAGDNQAGLSSTAVSVPPSVTVKDASGNPVPGVTVTFSVASGGGSVTGAVTTSNASGVATVGSWRLGSEATINTLTATVTGLPPVTFTATRAFLRAGGNHYVFISEEISWQLARNAALAMTFQGVSGHLANITSAAENAFINSAFNRGGVAFAWFDGNEPLDNGVWKWAHGPEAGTTFSNGAVAAPPFNYANWGGGEPNDAKASEDYAMFNLGAAFAGIQPGQWADAAPTPSAQDPVIGYVVEFETGPPAVPPVIGFNFRQGSLAAGGVHTCGLTVGGAAYCWGRNFYGTLGDGSTTNSTTPVAVTGGIAFASLTGGAEYNCGLTSGGAAYCWGYGAYGQLGVGTAANSTTPVAVVGDLTLVSVWAGLRHTCGFTRSGEDYCWGYNEFGQLGDGTTFGRIAPVAVATGGPFLRLAPGLGHTCGLAPGGAAYCWGYNGAGELGNGTTGGNSTTPVAVAGGHTFTSLVADFEHSCGLTGAGAAYCWGYNQYGALGDGTTSNRDTPVAVAGGVTFASLTTGELHTCGLTSAGAAYCWGLNVSGELGDGTTTNSSTPVAVAGGITFAILTAGGQHTCGQTSAGAAYCWGLNQFGQLGDGTTTDRTTPVAVVNP